MWTKIGAALLAVSTAIVPIAAGAWDYPGHRIVGEVADVVLKQHHPKAHARVRALLDLKDASGKVVDKRSLGDVAVFPDCAKDEEEYCRRLPSQEEIAYAARNPKHQAFHFTNTPMQLKAYLAGGVGTSSIDIVQMIAYAVAQLRGASPAAKDNVSLTDSEAVWLLAHLVGDIHQPLHVGAKYFDKECEKGVDPYSGGEFTMTLGGNRINLAATPPAVPPAPNLHLYWDRRSRCPSDARGRPRQCRAGVRPVARRLPSSRMGDRRAPGDLGGAMGGRNLAARAASA